MTWRALIASFCALTLLWPLSRSSAHDIPDLIDEHNALELQRAEIAAAPLANERKARLYGVVAKTYLWTTPRLRVCFGPAAQHSDKELLQRISRVAEQWLSELPISFDFGAPDYYLCDGASSYEIRVALHPQDSPTFWSLPGSDSVSKSGRRGYEKYSMMLGFPKDRRNFHWLDYVFDFYVLHEFGHALGFLHEHQAKDCKFDRNYLISTLKYDAEFVDKHLMYLEKYDLSAYPLKQGIRESSNAIATEYDKASVMQYWFRDPKVFAGGEASPCYRKDWVDRLSARDVIAVRAAYRRLSDSLRLASRTLGNGDVSEAAQRTLAHLKTQSLDLMTHPEIQRISRPPAGLAAAPEPELTADELTLLRRVLLMRFQ